MSLLKAYLQQPSTQRILGRKPGEMGFSLIELVVVVAVLAILAAVAIPNFLSVSKDGQIAAAKNTLATIVKECTSNDLKGKGTKIGEVQSALAKLNGYNIQDSAGSAVTTATATSCYTAKTVDPDGVLPSFEIGFDTTTGATSKQCTLQTGDSAYNPGTGSCDPSQNDAGTAW